MSYKVGLGINTQVKTTYRSFDTRQEAEEYRMSVFREASNSAVVEVQEPANSRFINRRPLDRKVLTVLHG